MTSAGRRDSASVVKISASYPGASALTVSQAVATPIEQEINGTPGNPRNTTNYIEHIDSSKVTQINFVELRISRSQTKRHQPGASALTVSQAVATPIEQEINGTPGMLYMESNSSNSGGFSATVTFDVSADPDLAAVEIQNRVKLAEIPSAGGSHSEWYFGRKQAPSQLMTLC